MVKDENAVEEMKISNTKTTCVTATFEPSPLILLINNQPSWATWSRRWSRVTRCQVFQHLELLDHHRHQISPTKISSNKIMNPSEEYYHHRVQEVKEKRLWSWIWMKPWYILHLSHHQRKALSCQLRLMAKSSKFMF